MVRKTSEQIRAVRLTPAQRRRLDAMTDAQIAKAAKSDPDNPPLTESELERLRRGGRPRLPDDERKELLTLRLPPSVIADYKATGHGWQRRMGDVLKNHMPMHAKKKAEEHVMRSIKGAAIKKAAKSAKRVHRASKSSSPKGR
jgi:uncharacterized protein (DUF4415 family)